MKAITTAHQARIEYDTYLREGRLVAGAWQQERDGRHLACALGVLGIDRAADCPAQVMPAWLAHLVPRLFDGASSKTVRDNWGSKLYEQLDRLDGDVPDSVRDLLLADTILPIARESLRSEWVGKIGPAIDVMAALIRWRAAGEDVTAEIEAQRVVLRKLRAAADADAAADAVGAAANAAADAAADAVGAAANAAAAAAGADVRLSAIDRIAAALITLLEGVRK